MRKNCLTPWHLGGFGYFHKKNSGFRLPYQRPSSSADCARELFNGSNGWDKFFYCSLVVKGDWVKIWTCSIQEVDLCILLAVLPTWHKTNINLCRSLLMLKKMTSLQLHRSSQYNISISVPPYSSLTSLLIEPSAHAWLLLHAILLQCT